MSDTPRTTAALGSSFRIHEQLEALLKMSGELECELAEAKAVESRVKETLNQLTKAPELPKEFEDELDSCDATIKWCEENGNDWYGINFPQGRRSGIITGSIIEAKAKETLRKERDALRGENERIVAEAKQCHSRNDELVQEHLDLRAETEQLKRDGEVERETTDRVCRENEQLRQELNHLTELSVATMHIAEEPRELWENSPVTCPTIEAVKQLRKERDEAKAEAQSLAALLRIPDDVCLSCGGIRGHEEGCRGTTALVAMTSERDQFRAELVKMEEERDSTHKIRLESEARVIELRAELAAAKDQLARDETDQAIRADAEAGNHP